MTQFVCVRMIIVIKQHLKNVYSMYIWKNLKYSHACEGGRTWLDQQL
jgi:hypothetical protein